MTLKYGSLTYFYNKKKYNIKFNPGIFFKNDHLSLFTKLEALTNNKIFKLTITPVNKIKIDKICILCSYNFEKKDKIFLNGYQSWTETREVPINKKIPGLRKSLKPFLNIYKVKNFGDYFFKKYTGRTGRFHGYTYTYIKNINNNINFIGSLSEKEGFTIFNYNTKKNQITITKDCKLLIIDKPFKAFDLIFINNTENDTFKLYFNKLNLKAINKHPSAGWTSWYNYYTDISEKIIMENLNSFKDKKIPIDVFQIDDGYQKSVGDWLEIKNNFPNGMKYISDQIKKSGYKAGIWIAPFICQKKSSIFNNHNDWILKDKQNKPVIAGYSKGYWNDCFYTMDFYNNDFKKYLKEVLNTIFNKWGFDLIKVDFIYALGLYDISNKSRSEIFFEAVDFIRSITKNKMILGCGTPLAPAFGKFDYCRIGSDIALTWENNLYKWINYRERVSSINSILNTIHRRHLNNYAFLNDPDVYNLRNENNNLTNNQKYTLFLLNQIFANLIFTSDNINNYDDETLKLYLSQFPLKPKEITEVKNNNTLYEIHFNIGKLGYIVYSNLGSKIESVSIDKNIYFCNKNRIFMNNQKIILQPFESRCFLKIDSDDFIIAGSSGHLFPGSEVDKFEIKKDNIILAINKKLKNKSEIYINIPHKYMGYKINGKFIKSQKIMDLNIIKYIFNTKLS